MFLKELCTKVLIPGTYFTRNVDATITSFEVKELRHGRSRRVCMEINSTCNEMIMENQGGISV
jgi:hypothetical protein